jgi:uncharacterized coiled-coil protein SlyX
MEMGTDYKTEWAVAESRIKDLEVEVERLERLLAESNRQLALAQSETEAVRAVCMSKMSEDPLRAFAETVFSPVFRTKK